MYLRHQFISLLLVCLAQVPLWAAQVQPAAPAQMALDANLSSGNSWSAGLEKPPAGGLGANTPNQPSPAATDAVKGDGKPIHEELSRSNLQEAIKEFNAGEAGGKKPNGDEPATASNPQRNPLSPAAKAAKEQANRAEWAKVNQPNAWGDDVLPWAWAVAGLLSVGLAFRLWLSRLRAKAARPGMRRRAARKIARALQVLPRSGLRAGDAQSLGGDA